MKNKSKSAVVPAQTVVRDQEIRRRTLLIRELLVNGAPEWKSFEHSIANALDEIDGFTR